MLPVCFQAARETIPTFEENNSSPKADARNRLTFQWDCRLRDVMDMPLKESVDVAILGGGAAGLMCAHHLGTLGIRSILLEKNSKVGKKILISGGGRCNFTNLDVSFENFRSSNAHYARSALARYPSSEFIELVNARGIEWYEKNLGQLFCRTSAREIVSLLVDGAVSGGAEIVTDIEVHDVRKALEGFLIKTSRGDLIARKVVVATGGLSIPKIGASKIGYDIARAQGLKVTETRPALVALEAGGALRDLCRSLSGVSLDAEVRAVAGGPSFREQVLFTHWGLSGPAILQASLYWEPKTPIEVNWHPSSSLEEPLLSAMRDGSKVKVGNWLNDHLPSRFVETWVAEHLLNSERPLSQMGAKALKGLLEHVHRWRFVPSGTGGYKKAEVTVGGVDTNALNSKTMEVRSIPNLFFIGEVVDVTGWLGGYNFQWAWASAVAAAKAISES